MDTIADRSLRVAVLGVVPDDDPHIIADMMCRIEKLEAALRRLRDCDWVITLPDRMDAVRAIAREALED